MSVSENLHRIQDQIEKACQKAGRSAGDVLLIGVSKTKSVELIREAYEAGLRDFGENYVQEWEKKAKSVSDLTDLSWHFIGALQRNKAKLIVGQVAYLHTLDRPELADQLDQRAQTAGVTQKVLLEVNISGETTKAGVPQEQAFALAERILALPSLSLEGLMCVPEPTPNEGTARQSFERLRRLRDEIARQAQKPLPHLSMGMSSDFEWAIAEGSTMVRIGTALFGER